MSMQSESDVSNRNSLRIYVLLLLIVIIYSEHTFTQLAYKNIDRMHSFQFFVKDWKSHNSVETDIFNEYCKFN